MYYSWLDQWDERKAQLGYRHKMTLPYELGAEFCFDDAANVTTIDEFGDLAELFTINPDTFETPKNPITYVRDKNWLSFQSDILTDVARNNTVWAKITESGSRKHALILVHHWGASKRNAKLANLLSKFGITTIEFTMSYHFERGSPDQSDTNLFVGPNLGRTIQSVRQSLLDARRLVQWLKDEGYEEISALGVSMGSWVAAILAAHEPNISKCSLFLAGASAADTTWTGRAQRYIKAGLENHITLEELRRAWSPLNLENYTHLLARPELDLHMVLAKRDRVIVPKYSEAFIEKLINAGAEPKILRLNCGHYSLGKMPYSLFAAASLIRFLKGSR